MMTAREFAIELAKSGHVILPAFTIDMISARDEEVRKECADNICKIHCWQRENPPMMDHVGKCMYCKTCDYRTAILGAKE